MFKKIFIPLLVLSFLALANNVFAQDKLAFIDLNFLFNNSSAGKKINDEIKNKRKKINTQFEEYKDKINSEKKTLLDQKNVIAEDEYRKKLIDIESNIKNFNSKIANQRKELAEYNNKAKAEFSKQLRLILEEYSENNSISMIIRKENLLIGKTNLDVTNDILELFNKNVKKITIK